MIMYFEMFNGPDGRYLGTQPVDESKLDEFLCAGWSYVTYRLLCVVDEVFDGDEKEVWV